MSVVNNKILISIIIPVYNSEKFIERTLDSVSSQSLENLEVICIDDGSSDQSLALIEKMAGKDPRIKIIKNTINLGVSLTRNVGIEAATGEYITFVDHDDELVSNMYEKLYDEAERNQADFVHSDVYIHTGEQVSITHFPSAYQSNDRELLEKMTELLIIEKKSDRLQDLYLFGIWNKIYRTNFIKQNMIRFFSEREFSNEDFLFNLQVFLKATKVSCVYQGFYHFHVNPASLGKTYQYRNFELRFKGIELAKKMIVESDSSAKDKYYKRLLHRLWMVVVYSSSNELKRNVNGKIAALKQIRKNLAIPLVKEAAWKIDIQDTTIQPGLYKVFEKCLYYFVKFGFGHGR